MHILLACRDGCLLALLVHWIAVCIACLEVEVEGVNGWASKLPTWRRRCALLCGSRPLTGYHVALTMVLISTSASGGVILAILESTRTAFACVLLSLSIFVLAMLFEDAYWFVLNYAFHEAVARGEASDHFHRKRDQFLLYLVCTVVGSTLFVLGYGAYGEWARGGMALGWHWLFSCVDCLVVVAGVRPLYVAMNAHLHDKKIANADRLIAQGCVVLSASLVCALSCTIAIGVWRWVAWSEHASDS